VKNKQITFLLRCRVTYLLAHYSKVL